MTVKITMVGAEDGVEVFFKNDTLVPCPDGEKAASSLQTGDAIIMPLSGEVVIASVEEV